MAEVPLSLLLQADGATSGAEDFKKFGDHFGEHPKTTGKTFTGGAEKNLKAQI